MAVGNLESDLRVERVEDLLAGSEFGLGGGSVGSGEGSVGRLELEGAVGRVETVHHREELVLAKFDLHDTFGFEYTSTSSLVGVHLHHTVGVD
jgi:hypothetical protein